MTASDIPARPATRGHPALRRMILAAAALVLAQAGIGMAVNLYTSLPDKHPGARPTNYFTGSTDSVAWAITQGLAALAIHAILGLALIATATAVTPRAFRLRQRNTRGLTLAAVLLIAEAVSTARASSTSTMTSVR